MKKKFIIGDTIKYMGSDCTREYDREQVIIGIRSYDGYITTKFVDTGEENGFGSDSIYIGACKMIKFENKWAGNILKFRFV